MGFDHYMYVVRCSDGTLYTGYATDVERRVATHNAGKGAKYTKVRRPVTLVDSARFYTKSQAMSAEARFKLLDRHGKDELLSSPEPLESALYDRLDGFVETCDEYVARRLCGAVDPAYKAFMAPLVPTVDPSRLMGVRTPELRAIAREACGMTGARDFLKSAPHDTFEQDQVHSFMIGRIRDVDALYDAYEAFIPHLDNWAVCDQLATKPLMADPARARDLANRLVAEGMPYVLRYGILLLMKGFLGELFDPGDYGRVLAAGTSYDGPERKYVDMVRAWYFAEALAVRGREAYDWLDAHVPRTDALWRLTRRKARDSRRVPRELKELL